MGCRLQQTTPILEIGNILIMVQIVLKQAFFKNSILRSAILKTLVFVMLIAGISACGRTSSTSNNSDNSSDNISISKETSRMKKARDFNPKNMFGEEQTSDTERLGRLERMVQTLRNDFDSVSPSIKRLMVLEGDLQTLIAELQEITQLNPGQLQPIPPEEMVQPQQPAVPRAPAQTMAKKHSSGGKKIYNKTPPPLTGQAAVYDVRVGEHKGKTRIVIDVNAKTPHSVSLDNSEGIMVVELPQAAWQAATSRNYRTSGFLKSYNVEKASEGNTGYFLIFQLKRDAQLSYERVLPALSGGGAQRIVFDLSGGGYIASTKDK